MSDRKTRELWQTISQQG